MIVDDDDDIRASISDLLALDGHRVVAVENGEQAVGALAVATPQAIVTDLAVPMTSGYSLSDHIRSAARTRNIPVCVVSAEPSAAPEGTVVIRKPFELADLREAVQRATRPQGPPSSRH